MAAYKKALELNKNNIDAGLNLARLQAKTGALDDALATCNNGAQNNPKEFGFYMPGLRARRKVASSV